MTSTTTGITAITTPTDTQAALTRTFDAPRELLFEAYTNPKHIPQWLLGPAGWSMPVCELDLRPGGQWHYVWRKDDDGSEMAMTGTYREVTRPSRIVCTESWGGDWPETVNTIEFTEVDGRTTCTTTIQYPSIEARDAAIATGMKDGADSSFALLDNYLKTL